jgi:hypothetical protein
MLDYAQITNPCSGTTVARFLPSGWHPGPGTAYFRPMADVPTRFMLQPNFYRGRCPSCVPWLLVFAVLVQFAGPAEAGPIKIRARATIEKRVERSDAGIHLRGRLLDELGSPVPNRPIHITVKGLVPPKVSTAEDGSFQVLIESEHIQLIEAKEGRFLSWSIEFVGDGAYGADSVTGTLDLLRAPTWLEVEASPNPAHIASDELRVTVTAKTGKDRTVAGAEIQLQFADGPLLVGQAGPQGVITFLIRPLAIGDVGVLKINAYFRGNERYAASSNSINAHLSHLTRTTLRIGREGAKATGRYRFSGRVSYSGGPISQATVNIVARGTLVDGNASGLNPELTTRVVSVASTDRSGVYLATVSGARLFADFDQVLELRALATPDPDSYSPSSSLPIDVAVPTGQFMPARLYLVALAWVLALLFLVQLVRRGHWRRRWATFLSKRRAKRLRALAPPEVAFIEMDGSYSDERRQDWLTGRVLARYSERPLCGARVELRSRDGHVLSTTSDTLGAVALGPVSPGLWQLSLHAMDHGDDSSPIEFPHGGQLDGSRFLLTSNRHAVRLALGAWLHDAGMPWRWGYETLRDAARSLGRARPELLDEMETKVHRVEAAWYQAPRSHGNDSNPAMDHDPEKELG